MVTDMVSTKQILTGAGLLIATLTLLAGGASAQANAIADAGGQATAAAQGAYHADASGATDAAEDNKDNAHAQAVGQYEQTNQAYEESEANAESQLEATERPDRPKCNCSQAFAQAEQAGSASLEHSDQLNHAQDVDTEYVDAGGQASGFAQVGAWFSDAFDGAEQAYNELKGLMGADTNADQHAKAQAKQTLDAEDKVRAEAGNAIKQNPDLPDVNPQADGQLSADHATQVASSAAGEAAADS